LKSALIVLVCFALLAGLLGFISIRGRRATMSQGASATESKLDSSWNYQIGLPVTRPDHDVSITFQIKPDSGPSSTTQAWLATYSAEGHTVRFIIEIDNSNRTETHGIPMQFGKGRLIAVEGSDDRSILPALAFALGGVLPMNTTKERMLVFDYVHFGDRMSPIPGGGFQFKPPGDWTAMKLFFDGATEDDQATVYFSLNAEHGEAQFSMSNSDYGDPVLRHLATVL